MEGGHVLVVRFEGDRVETPPLRSFLLHGQPGLARRHDERPLGGVPLYGQATVLLHQPAVVAQQTAPEDLGERGGGGFPDRLVTPRDHAIGPVAGAADREDFIPRHDLLDGHLVLGERARLVRADHRGAAQGLHRGQLADDGAPARHAGHADGQRDGHGRGKPLGDGAHGQGHGRHEHVEGALSPQDAHQEGDGRQGQDHVEQHPAEIGDLAQEGGLQLLGLRDELGDAAHLRVVPDGNHDPGRLPEGDQGGSVGHVAPVGKHRVVRQDLLGLPGRDRLAGEGGLVDLEVPGGRQAEIRRDLVPGLEQDDVSGHHLCRRDARLFACPQDRCLGDHGPGKCLHGLDRPRLLDEAYHGVDEDHPEDDPGVDPFLEHGRDDPRSQEDVDQGLVELEEEAEQGTLALLRGDDVFTEPGTTLPDLEQVEPLLRVALQDIEDLVRRHVVPVFSYELIHDPVLLSGRYARCGILTGPGVRPQCSSCTVKQPLIIANASVKGNLIGPFRFPDSGQKHVFPVGAWQDAGRDRSRQLAGKKTCSTVTRQGRRITLSLISPGRYTKWQAPSAR